MATDHRSLDEPATLAESRARMTRQPPRSKRWLMVVLLFVLTLGAGERVALALALP